MPRLMLLVADEAFGCDNPARSNGSVAMTERDFDSKLSELDRLLNDPDVSLEPARVWSLLAEVSQFHAGTNAAAVSA
jgi:hypothetical protein